MKRVSLWAVALLFLAIPVLAAAPEVTIPVVGRLERGTDTRTVETYYTELAVTNHRDVEQIVTLDFVGGEHLFPHFTKAFMVPPKATVYGPLQLSNTREQPNWIGALRITAVIQTLDAEELPIYTPDPAGQIDAKAFIVHEHGRFGLFGTSRQEMEGIPAAEYFLPAATFFGTLHQPPNFYTNVGITNLHPTETVTFFVHYRNVDPIAVTVGPRSSQQIRISGGTKGFDGSNGRYAVVTPAWAVDGGTPTPWVAYASTVDILTGDAFTGLRTPHDITKTILK